MMSRRLFGLSAAALPFADRAQAQDGAPDYDAVLQAAFEAASATALGGAVVGPAGVRWSGVRGLRRPDGPAATVEDLWHLGSNTKAMTAALYARLVEAGQARWGATLPDLFPDLSVDPAFRETTIEELLSHRAGVLDAAALPPSWFAAEGRRDAPLTEIRTAVAARVLNTPPTGTPRTMVYGNANYVLAGAAIERLTGLAWEDAMRRHVFDPLNIATAGFGAPRGDQPWGHQGMFGMSQAVDPERSGSDNPPALGPAGTAHMSLADYGRFLAVFLGGADGFLTADSITRLTTAAPGADYALGWISYAQRDWARGPVLAHEGSNTLWHVIAVLAPARRLGFVAVTNDASRGMAASQDLVQRLIQATE